MVECSPKVRCEWKSIQTWTKNIFVSKVLSATTGAKCDNDFLNWLYKALDYAFLRYTCVLVFVCALTHSSKASGYYGESMVFAVKQLQTP